MKPMRVLICLLPMLCAEGWAEETEVRIDSRPAALRVLQRLAARTDRFDYGDKARATLASFAGAVDRYPSGFAYLLAAADELLHGELGERRYAAQGGVRIEAALETTATPPRIMPLRLRLQACNDQVCLPPETMELHLALTDGGIP